MFYGKGAVRGINLQNSQVFLLVLLDEVCAVALKFIGRLLISI